MIQGKTEIEELEDIDRTSKEGKMFFASLAILTTELYPDNTPSEVIKKVLELKNKIES